MGFGPETQVSEREALLWGNIHHFYFPKLLVYLEAAKKTGILTVTCDRVIKRIFLRDGVPTAARSNLKSELIGEFLVAQNMITREQQEQALQAQRGIRDSFGAILLHEEMIAVQDLFAYARRQFLTILFSLFGLQEGGFRFDERSLPKDLYRYKVSFSNMILFGTRQIPDSETLGRMIGDLSHSPAPTNRFMEYKKLAFSVEELSVIRYVDGVRSVEAILERSGLKRVTALRTLLILFCHGLVKFPFRRGPEEKEGVIDLASSTRDALGMTSYESKDENEEKAVAGNDFLVSPEGIYASGTGESEQERISEATEEKAMEEKEVLPRKTSDMPVSLTFDAAEVTGLNSVDVDDTFAGPKGEGADSAGEDLGLLASSPGSAPREPGAPQDLPRSPGPLTDEDREDLSGPVARAYRTRLKDKLEREELSMTSSVVEADDEAPSLPDGEVDEPIVTGRVFPMEEALARTALSEAEGLNVPSCGIEDVEEASRIVPRSDSPFDHEEERRAILSGPVGNASEDEKEEGMDDRDSGDEEALEMLSVLGKRSGAGLAYLVLLTFVAGLGIFSMTPWREELMDRLLTPPPMVAEEAVPAVPAVVAFPPLPEGEEPHLPSQADPELQEVPEGAVSLPAAVPDVVKADSPSLTTWEERMAAWTRRLWSISPARYTIQMEIGGNLVFLRQDLDRLPPGLDAMLVPFRVGDWKAYTLLVGIFESRVEGQEALQKLPPALRVDHPLIRTLETIRKGLRRPE